jgi:hypothetical protein
MPDTEPSLFLLIATELRVEFYLAEYELYSVLCICMAVT